MCSLPKFALGACILECGSWQMQGQVSPIPIRGGDIIPPFVTQFFPGPGVGFDGLNAEPHRITNFSIVAMGYTSGADTMAVTTVTLPASVERQTRMPRSRLLALTLEERSAPV